MTELKARFRLGFFTPRLYPSAPFPAPNGKQQAVRLLTNKRNPTEVSTMHVSIQQRVDGVAALRVRTRIATAEFYALIGKEQPVQQVRFQIKNVGNAYHIVERSTGKVRGFRWTWKAASNFAQSMEFRADGFKPADPL